MTQAHAESHSDDHGHGHAPAWLAHHFDTPKQQFDSGKLGIWVFLATEILMFGGLFCAYAVWRTHHYESFQIGHLFLNKFWGAFNTIVLIASSFTMAWGVRTAQLGRRGPTLILLGLTFLGGVGFMCVKYVEYAHKFHAGIGPGKYYNPLCVPATDSNPGAAVTATTQPGQLPTAVQLVQSPASAHHADELERHVQVEVADPATGKMKKVQRIQVMLTAEQMAVARPFFSIYFLMTGLHGIHVVVGMGLIAWVFLRCHRGDFSAEYNAPVDIVGLYWHLVDLIWIFLFPLLYLIGV